MRHAKDVNYLLKRAVFTIVPGEADEEEMEEPSGSAFLRKRAAACLQALRGHGWPGLDQTGVIHTQ